MCCSLKIQTLILILFLVENSFELDAICSQQETCESCLSANFNCAWCIDKEYTSKIRCMTESDLLKSGCSSSRILRNSPKIDVVEDKDLQNLLINGTRTYAQLKPQKLRIKLVKSHTQRFKMTYRQAQNNPLDLYFLMDLTWSMKDDKQTLVKIGEQLTVAIEKLTNNFRLGYGSFADKPAMPMTSLTTKENPCIVLQDKCEPTYGFHHHLALTKNIKNFAGKVDASKVTGNLDNLEGGLDALMQVIVCSDQIGWSEDARKIVILATDGFMHFAGDGKLAGIVRKNDKKCHLSKVNDYWEYTGSLEYDYPSLEEIYRELVSRKISVIFAVTKDVLQPYQEMQKLMKDVSEVEILKNDSSNILDLVKKGYERFVKRVQFEDNSPSYISVVYETDCGGLHEMKTKNYCDDLQTGKEINFFINITLEEFPNDGKYNHLIKIEESGISEYLELEIEIQKPCPCEESESDRESENLVGEYLCNSHGKFSCGMCTCTEGWLGSDCSCDSQNYTSIRALEEQCRKPLENSSSTAGLGAICSNQGECECGKCHCYMQYTGRYCECRECENCNDPKRTECRCGECVCKPGWSGIQCDCPGAVEPCIAPNGEVCTDHGECKCGVCECKDSYYGKFCEIDAYIGNKLCEYYEPCVTCFIKELQDTGSCEHLEEICTRNDSSFYHKFVDELLDSDNKCLIRLKNKDGVKCDHYYEYDTDESGKSYIKIRIETCQSVLNVAAFWGIIIFCTTLVLGLLILFIIKIYFHVKDKRECAQFEKQIQQQSFEMQSPIYKSPITYYSVPKPDDDFM